MSRQDRKKLIEEIEKLRNSRVLSYVTGDRPPIQGGFADDAVRPIYDHLRAIGHVERLDLLLYSRGGAIDVPWRLARVFSQVSNNWSVLIPFRANSAATLLALGADEIILGRLGELGPIDPTLQISKPAGNPPQQIQDQVSVEDVMAYVKFARERFGLSDQESLTAGMGKLAERIDPVAIGNVYRTHSHIRDVARRMLASRAQPMTEQEMSTIIETLAERVYAHGHAIGVEEAKNIGLPAKVADEALDDKMWALLCDYEEELMLLEPLDPFAVIATDDRHTEQLSIAVIESTWATDRFVGTLQVQAIRQMPPQLNVALNLNLQVPPVDPTMVAGNGQQALQQFLAALQQAVAAQANQAVQEALKLQAPLAGTNVRFESPGWTRETMD